MADIQAFRAIRYNLGHVGSLSDVVAPPYDVIDPPLQEALYKRHPANVIRLILNRPEPGDDEQSNRYTRAARFLHNWLREGVLQQDPQAAIYVYHQQFRHNDQLLVRRGFMARVRLEPFGTGNIFPHEETHAAAKADRLQLMRHCRANLSPIFGIYPDPENAAQETLEASLAGVTPVEATDHLGVVHRLWPVTDSQAQVQATALMGPKPLFIADGHHRYETACTYRDELAAAGPLDRNHPANWVLMMCVSMNDPGMIVLPTHRLLRGLPALTADDLAGRLQPLFSLTAAGHGAGQAHAVWQSIQQRNDQSTIGLFTHEDQRWTLATITDAGRAKMAEVAAAHSQPWQGLGVAILHQLIVPLLAELSDLPQPKYVHEVQQVVTSLEQGDEEGRRFPLAALVMPATLEHIQAISRHGERMPAKSTYFYPKLLSGLVINPLQ